MDLHPHELWPAEDGEPRELLRREARLAEPAPVAVLRVGDLAPVRHGQEGRRSCRLDAATISECGRVEMENLETFLKEEGKSRVEKGRKGGSFRCSCCTSDQRERRGGRQRALFGVEVCVLTAERARRTKVVHSCTHSPRRHLTTTKQADPVAGKFLLLACGFRVVMVLEQNEDATLGYQIL